MTQFKKPYLVQRLEAPRTGNLSALADAFSFGGGLVNGGLSKEAFALLKTIMSFDYMGSSEFEWGAVPEAFQLLAKSKLVCGVIDEKKPVYYICDQDITEGVQQWVHDEIAGKCRQGSCSMWTQAPSLYIHYQCSYR